MPDTQVTDDRAGEAVVGEQTAGNQIDASSEGDRGGNEGDLEKLKKQVQDLEKERDRAKSEWQKEQAERQKLAEKAERLETEFLGKVTEAVSTRGQESASAEQEKRIQGYVDRLKDADESEYVAMMNDFAWQARQDALEEAKKMLSGEKETSQAKINELEQKLAQIAQSVEDNSPEYVRRKDHIAALAEKYELDPRQNRELLLKLSKDIEPNLGTPQRELPPGTSSAGRSAGTGEEPVELTETLINFYRARGITDKQEMIAIEKKHAQRNWRSR